ncbi:hypothetical protein TRFO_31526 [Tritrichomonas foetus]|uniref:DUF3447 domain-containing protein n=1 Tax=Tritrichomonas foetus TaxID=1144522 RepID=A0A1J4JT81_9EUKA|nr:hypothetical protein TRFO_31526 [Tritrichomonas foetus]|eukprot:OHT01640.1 hypothetical protein TRFO_31526 [Tritrichomonas foetus]
MNSQLEEIFQQLIQFQKTITEYLETDAINEDQMQCLFHKLNIHDPNLPEARPVLDMFLRMLCYLNIAMSNSNNASIVQFMKTVEYFLPTFKKAIDNYREVNKLFNDKEIFRLFKYHNPAILHLFHQGLLKPPLANYTIENYFITEMYYFSKSFTSANITKEQYNSLRESNIHSIDEISHIIRSDNAILFQEYFAKTNLDVNSEVPECFYEINKELSKNERKLSMLDYASYFGSLDIFKYLLLNNAEISQFTPIYAVIGGNSEIMHILEDSKVIFTSKCMKKAIKYHRNNIFNYLHETIGISLEKEHIKSCLKYLNFEALYSIVNNKPDFLTDEVSKLFILQYAIKYRVPKLAVYFAADPSIEINKHFGKFNRSLLTKAVINYQSDTVIALLKNPKIDINFTAHIF